MLDHAPLVELDPELGSELDARRRQVAERDVVVRLGRVRTGRFSRWDDRLDAAGGIGLLVVAGHAVRRIALEHRAAAEILGPGDLARPWQGDGEHSVYPFEPGWEVIDELTLAVVDRSVTLRLGPFPEITSALVGRAMNRSRRLAGHLVLAQLASVEHRITLALWHLADDWGRAVVDGIALPVPITHEQLGLLVGARRSAVTSALGRLADAGEIARPGPRGGFLLTGPPPAQLQLVRGRAHRDASG